MSSQIEKTNKKELQLEAMKNEVQKENQIAKEQCGSIKTAMGKVNIFIQILIFHNYNNIFICHKINLKFAMHVQYNF